MSGSPHKSDATGGLERADQVDVLCDQFEDAWQAGSRPGLGDYLRRLDRRSWPEAIRELLRLEVHYRRRAGERPTAAEYLGQFPDLADIVTGCFDPEQGQAIRETAMGPGRDGGRSTQGEPAREDPGPARIELIEE